MDEDPSQLIKGEEITDPTRLVEGEYYIIESDELFPQTEGYFPLPQTGQFLESTDPEPTGETDHIFHVLVLDRFVYLTTLSQRDAERKNKFFYYDALIHVFEAIDNGYEHGMMKGGKKHGRRRTKRRKTKRRKTNKRRTHRRRH